MSLCRPNSLILKARNPPIAINTVCEELAAVHLHTHLEGIQRISYGEWCITFRNKEVVNLALTTFRNEEERELIATPLKVNEEGMCRLESVPVEYPNTNIHKHLSEFFEGLRIEDEYLKNLPEGFPEIKSGTRLLRYTKIRVKPERRVFLGRGIVGFLNDLAKTDIAKASVMCQKCGSDEHVTNTCKNPFRCRKCGILGHRKEECEQGDCKRCQSNLHTTELCQRKAKKCEKCGQMGHIAIECERRKDKIEMQVFLDSSNEEIEDNTKSQIATRTHSPNSPSISQISNTIDTDSTSSNSLTQTKESERNPDMTPKTSRTLGPDVREKKIKKNKGTVKGKTRRHRSDSSIENKQDQKSRKLEKHEIETARNKSGAPDTKEMSIDEDIDQTDKSIFEDLQSEGEKSIELIESEVKLGEINEWQERGTERLEIDPNEEEEKRYDKIDTIGKKRSALTNVRILARKLVAKAMKQNGNKSDKEKKQ